MWMQQQQSHQTYSSIRAKENSVAWEETFILFADASMNLWKVCETTETTINLFYGITLSPIIVRAMAFNQHSTNGASLRANINKKHKYLVYSLSRLQQYQTSETLLDFCWRECNLVCFFYSYKINLFGTFTFSYSFSSITRVTEWIDR